MVHLWFSAALLSLLSGSLALSSNYLECQSQKPAGTSPLVGCPSGTIFVSQNTSDAYAKFHTVQEAVSSLNNLDSATILIAKGEYQETVSVARQGYLTLLGQLPSTASESLNSPFANASQVPFNQNLVKIWNNQYVQSGVDDIQSAVLVVGAPLYASFGNPDFKVYNIDFENRAANYDISQALVIAISYSYASFYGCSFASYQDTWYTGDQASTYVVDSIIYGQTDYLFGFGTAWFQSVVLANRGCGGAIAAWQGTSDVPGNRHGAYIADSSIVRSPDASAEVATQGLCYLGRPWNDLATTVYLRTYMDNSINKAGWRSWNDTGAIPSSTFYAEFDSSGPGGGTSARVAQDHILTADEAQGYTFDQVFLQNTSWIDLQYSY